MKPRTALILAVTGGAVSCLPLLQSDPVVSVGRGSTGTTVEFSWDTVAGQTYQLQTRASLTAGTWSALGPTIPGTGSRATTSASPNFSELEAFFRVEVLPSVTPPVIVPGNLLPNPSLENVTPGNSKLPDRWFIEAGGANNAAFSYQNTGHTGSRSMKVQITGYTNGAAELVHRAVPVTGGRAYTFWDYYQSDTYTEIDAEFNLRDGTTEYFYVGYTWPSTSWNKYRAVLTVPTNTVSLVVYHLLAEAGYLVTDDYALVQNPSTPATGFQRAIVSLTFDDGLSSHYSTAAPLLNANGQRATFYAVSSWVGDPDYMTVAQLNALLGSGHEIGGHSMTHSHLTVLDPTLLNDEVQQCQIALEQYLGTPVVSFATPYGEYNDLVIADVRRYYQSQRSTDVGFNTKDNVSPDNLVVQNVNQDVSTATVQSWVDQAIQNRSWLILVYHDISPDGDFFATTPANLSTELGYLKNSGVAVLTVKQALAEILAQ